MQGFSYGHCVLLSFFLLLIGSPILGQTNPAVDNIGEEKTDYSQDLKRIKTLIKGNVLGLAEAMLRQQGPPMTLQSQWINWQKQLWAIYEYEHNWGKLYRATKEVDGNLISSFRQFAAEKNIQAQIELGETHKARAKLRQKILQNTTEPVINRRLRRLMVESFLEERLLQDAATAMVIFQQEYRNSDESWLRIIAKIHLGLEQWDLAINILAPLNQPESRLLRLYANAQNQSLPLEKILSDAEQLLKDIDASKRIRIKDYQVLSVMINATQIANNFQPSLEEVLLLERYLTTLNTKSVMDNSALYPVFSAKDLLMAYDSNTIRLAREKEWLEDDYDTYFKYAKGLKSSDNSLEKRVLLGTLLQYITERNDQVELQNQYVNTLLVSGDTTLVPLLFGTDKPYGELIITDEVGVALTNLALQQENYSLAAWVNRHIDDIPDGVAQEDWVLNNARVAIFAGDYDLGTQKLLTWLNLVKLPSVRQLDQALQPVFDLQTVNRHQHAIEILEYISSLRLSARHQREVAYWLAQSYHETEQYIKAANQFLFSALQNDKGFDQWSESARFQAAESLLAAKLVNDARTLFNDLYKRASDPSRKTRLLQKLQQISLIESSS